MPLASAAETVKLTDTIDKEKFVNAVSNNAITDKNTALSKEEVAKLQKWLKDKNLITDNVLKLGSTGDQVKELQKWLKENNFYAGEIDGNFGADTETAVKAFQAAVGLKEDGEVGDYTLLAMKEWDEYSATANYEEPTTSASSTSSSSTLYSKVSAKSYSNYKSYRSYRSYRSYGGYTNGMDCWAMSAYLSGQLRSQGYNVRTIQYATSMSSRHRSVQVWNGNSWSNYDYKGNGYSSIYYATGNSQNGVVV